MPADLARTALTIPGLPQLLHPVVRLRPIERRDIQHWYVYLRLPQVHAHSSWLVGDPAELASHVWSSTAPAVFSAVRFAIARISDDQLVGTVGFHSVSAEHRSAELAYDLSPDFWGRGIVTAVCRELLCWAHAQLGIIRVQAIALETNQRSMRVLQQLGFVHEGLLRSYRMVRGRPGDFHMYAHISSTTPDQVVVQPVKTTR